MRGGGRRGFKREKIEERTSIAFLLPPTNHSLFLCFIPPSTTDPAISAALNKNVNLSEYSTVLDNQLADSEKLCVEAYAGKSKSLTKLQANIDDCDNILAGMQEMLLGFQADLSGISDEIKHLQEESMTMGVKLRNRKSAEHRVRAFLSNVVVSPDLAKTICNADVSADYLAYVIELNEKHAYVSRREPADDGR